MEIGEIKDVLCRHRDTFYSAFRYFSGLGAINERGDGFSMAEDYVETLSKACKLANENSTKCKFEDLQKIFDETNVEEETLDEQKEMAEVNLDRALLRFEFMQCLVRLRSQSMCMAASRLAARISPQRRLQMCRRLWSV